MRNILYSNKQHIDIIANLTYTIRMSCIYQFLYFSIAQNFTFKYSNSIFSLLNINMDNVIILLKYN